MGRFQQARRQAEARSRMRVVHTSDWHLGQELHGFDRSVEHEEFLGWLADRLGELEADALVVAGDVFDGVNPSVAAQGLLYRFLHRVTETYAGLQIVIVAGNHDSAARIELPTPLLDRQRVLLAGAVPRSDGRPAPQRLLRVLRGRDGRPALLCAAVPYLRPGDLPEPDDGESAVGVLYRQVVEAAERERDGLPLLVTGHLHVQGSQVCELSERRIMVGGEEAVAASVFPSAIDYVALGHLHRPQTVTGDERVRYCGAPMPMSMAEKGYRHSIAVVDFDAGDVREVRTVEVPRTIEFLRVPPRASAPLAEVEELLSRLDVADPGEARRAFLEVAVRVAAPEPDMRARVDAALAGKPVRLTRVVRDTAGAGAEAAEANGAEAGLDELRPEEVFELCHRRQYQTLPSPELKAAFAQLVAEVLHADPQEAAPNQGPSSDENPQGQRP